MSKSNYKLSDMLLVEIKGRRKAKTDGEGMPAFKLASDELARKFASFLVEHPEVKGYAIHSGMGNYTGIFDPEGREAIETFLKENQG